MTKQTELLPVQTLILIRYDDQLSLERLARIIGLHQFRLFKQVE